MELEYSDSKKKTDPFFMYGSAQDRGGTKDVDVVLVMPPFTGAYAPSLALGILKACLVREGISCRVEYADVAFGNALGSDLMNFINPGTMVDSYGEYIFAELAGITVPEKYRDIRAIPIGCTDAWQSVEAQKQLLCAKKICEEELERTVDRILASHPKCVGVSSTFQQRNPALAILRKIKEKNPEVKTFMGGANSFGYAGLRILKTFDFVDFVFFGESDGIFAEVLRKTMTDPTAPLPYGVLRRTDALPDEPPHRIEMDMDCVPYPDYDDFFELAASDRGKIIHESTAGVFGEDCGLEILLEGSRGCWWGEKCPCTFCGLHGNIRTFRMKDPDRFYEELRYMTRKYGVQRVTLTDCVMPQEWFNGFLQKLRDDPVKLTIFLETRTTMSADQIKLLSEAGFTMLQPGIESLSDHELKLMHKGTTALNNIHFLKYAKKYGMHCFWNILYGFPGENLEDYEIQIRISKLITHLMPPNGCSPILISRDNEYYTNHEKYSMKLTPSWFYPKSCPDDPEYLQDIAIQFDITNLYNPPEILEARDRLTDVVLHWRNTFHGVQGRVRLEMADLGDRILIIDTRECRDLRAQLLVGAERAVYLAAAHPVPVERLAAGIPEYGLIEVMGAVASLARKKLLLKYDNRVLALAVERSMEELKENDMLDFRSIHKSDRDFRERFQKRVTEQKADGMTEDEAFYASVTEFARKFHMCFTGEDYRKAEYERIRLPK